MDLSVHGRELIFAHPSLRWCASQGVRSIERNAAVAVEPCADTGVVAGGMRKCLARESKARCKAESAAAFLQLFDQCAVTVGIAHCRDPKKVFRRSSNQRRPADV